MKSLNILPCDISSATLYYSIKSLVSESFFKRRKELRYSAFYWEPLIAQKKTKKIKTFILAQTDRKVLYFAPRLAL